MYFLCLSRAGRALFRYNFPLHILKEKPVKGERNHDRNKIIRRPTIKKDGLLAKPCACYLMNAEEINQL